eukprot:TRINITY_DN60583_c0_g1_i1.p1 TRINITY_DN60583_c0_g1~~TRINITY_DN60583_c0_g1_i1.p1  ORF type:complete len:460 (+),score=138.48 TRINITY_DN60583_c0_g1_i1:77-1456(+)
MHASAELQSKLLRRLRLQHEDAIASSPAQRLLCPPLFQAQRLLPASASEAPPLPGGTASSASATSVEAGLEAEIQAVLRQRDAAIRRQKEIESQAVARGIEVGAEVARLRVEKEVLRRDLESTSNEVHKLRAGHHLEARLERKQQEKELQTSELLTSAEERHQRLLSEVEAAREARKTLEQKVQSLEEAVAKQVVNRVQLEVQLRHSEAREAELRRVLDTVGQAAEQRMYALDSGDEDGELATDDNDAADLEFSYEGLELSGLMSLDRALQLARRGTGQLQSEEGRDMEKLSLLEEIEKAPGCEGEESQYEEPLRTLELALARLQTRGLPLVPEAQREDAEYEEHVEQLQEVLSRIGSPEKALQAQAAGESRGEEAESPGDGAAHVENLQEVLSRLSSPEKLEALPAAESGRGESPPASAPEPIPPTAQPPPPLMSGFALLSPYAALGKRFHDGFIRQS